MSMIRLYRRRFVPDENIELKGDEILYHDEDILVTRWTVLRPRKDIDHGYSVYYLKEGYKISKMYDAADELVYWYCDIIDAVFDAQKKAYTFYDLLIDVLVYPDGHVEVADLDEFADFTEEGRLAPGVLAGALRKTDRLLQQIYRGEFERLTEPITLREGYCPEISMS